MGRPPPRLYPFIAVAVALALLLLARWQYPGSSGAIDRYLSILYLLAFLAFVGGAMPMRNLGQKQAMKYAAIWLAVVAALMLAYYTLLQLKG